MNTNNNAGNSGKQSSDSSPVDKKNRVVVLGNLGPSDLFTAAKNEKEADSTKLQSAALSPARFII